MGLASLSLQLIALTVIWKDDYIHTESGAAWQDVNVDALASCLHLKDVLVLLLLLSQRVDVAWLVELEEVTAEVDFIAISGRL